MTSQFRNILLLTGLLVISGCGQAGSVKNTEQNQVTIVPSGQTKIFNVVEQNFSFAYPIEWKVEPTPSAADFTSVSFVLGTAPKLYVEAPFVGHGFVFYTQNGVTYYLANPVEGRAPQPVALQTTKTIITNDTNTPVTVSVYRPCQGAADTKKCTPSDVGGFVVAYFERNNETPLLSSEVAGGDHNVHVLYTTLSTDAAENSAAIAAFETVAQSIKITDDSISGESDDTTASSTDEAPATQTYVNKKYSYSLTYPVGFTIAENANLSAWSLNPGTQFTFPAQALAGTNLKAAKVFVSTVRPDDAENSCLVPEINTEDTTVLIGGVEFTKSAGVNAFEGEYNENITYATVHGSSCYHVTLLMHVASMSESSTVKEFNRKAFVDLFEAMVLSFAFNDN